MVKKGRMAGAGMQDLVSAVAAKTGIMKENARTAIKAVREGILDLLKQSNRVQICMFGSFSMKKTAERQGRNPATGAAITIPAGYRFGFKFSKSWKDSMMPKNKAQAQKSVKPAAKAKAKPTARKGWKKR
jgi:DNA-binding protein HU-beta